MGVVSCAMSLSLHEAFDEDLPGRQARGPHTPDLSLMDPGIVLGRGGEADVCEDVEHRLGGARRPPAPARQSGPAGGPGLDDTAHVELDAAPCAHPRID